MELYTHLPNRLGLNLIDFDQFNHVDFLYSRDVSDMVYKSLINTVVSAEFANWTPVYDRTTSYNFFENDYQCNNIDFSERNLKNNKKGFWNKITSYIKKKEVHPLIKAKSENTEETIKSNNTFLKAWKEIIHL